MWAGASGPELEHRPDERSHHVSEEAVRGDDEVQALSVALPCGREYRPGETLVLGLGSSGTRGSRAYPRRESSRGQGTVDRARPLRTLATPPAGERAWRSKARYRQVRDRAEKRAWKSSAASSDDTTATSSGRAAERVGGALGRRTAVHVTLATRPSACTPPPVRPATARLSRLQTAVNDSRMIPLDRALTGLPRSTAEARAVVLERELQNHELTSLRCVATSRKYDLCSPEFRATTHATYALMREQDPVLLQPGLDGETPISFLTRYDDVVSALLDERLVLDPALALSPGQLEEREASVPLPVDQRINTHLLTGRAWS